MRPIRRARATDLGAAFAVALALAASPARADGPPARVPDSQERALAERLFVEGRIYLQDKEYERACPRFEKSYELDPTAIGTLLNMALCHEAAGKPASAWAEFRAVAAESRGKREDRVKLAEEHAQELARVLSFLTVQVPAAAKVPGLSLTLDGKPLPDMAWGTELPVDPGKHVVEAKAPDKVARLFEVTIGAKSDKQALTLTPLADAPKAAPGAGISLEAADAFAAARARRMVGFTLAGVGIASIGVGVVFGVLAVNARKDADAICPGNPCPAPGDADRAASSLRDASTDANIANVTVGAGVLAAAGGVLLVILSQPRAAATGRAEAAATGSASPTGPRVRVAASPAQGGGAVFVGGAF